MKKNKFFLGSAVAVASVSAIAPLSALTSCGNDVNEFFEIKYDEEYGVDEFAYKTIELEFKHQCFSKIDDKSISDKEKKAEKDSVNEDLTTFQNQIKEILAIPSASKSAYTIVSNALIEYAEREYGVRLNRNSKAQWSDIEDMYVGLRNSWKANLQASGITGDKLDTIMKDIEKNYKKMTVSLVEKYNDPLAALVKAKSELPVVFASVNTEIAYLAASSILKDFLSNYVLEFNEHGTNNKLDQLEKLSSRYDDELQQNVSFEVGNDITVFMNDIFVICNAKIGTQVPGGFTRHIIPGYRISPRLDGIVHDDYKNEHSIAISWECVKDTYEIGSDEAEKATAFSINYDRSTLANTLTSDASVYDVVSKFKDKRTTVDYSIPLTSEEEAKRLKNTFLNDNPTNDEDSPDLIGHIRIFWDKNSDTNYIDGLTIGKEIFPNGYDDNYNYYKVDSNNLAASGAKISINNDQTYNLSDLYEDANIIAPDHKSNRFEALPAVIQGLSMNSNISAIAKISKAKPTTVSIESAVLHYLDGSCEVPLDGDFDTSDINWKTSKKIWMQILNGYNTTRLLFNDYKDNAFDKDIKEIKKEKVLNDVMLSLTVVFDTLFILGAFLPTATIGEKTMSMIYLATSFIDMGLEIASYTIFRLHKYNIVKDYSDRLEEVRNTKEYKDLEAQLDSDKVKYNLIDGKPSTINGDASNKLYIRESDFNDAYEKYYKNNTQALLDLTNRYIHTNCDMTLQAFNLMLKAHDLDTEGYEEKMSGWSKNGRWEKASSSLMWSSMTLFAVEFIISCFDHKIAAAVNAKWPAKEGAHAAQNASKTFFGRMVDGAKRLIKGDKNAQKQVKDAAEEIKPAEKKYTIFQIADDPVTRSRFEDTLKATLPDKRPKLPWWKTVSDDPVPNFYTVEEGIEATRATGKYSKASDFINALHTLPIRLDNACSDSIHAVATAIRQGLINLAKKTKKIITFADDGSIVFKDIKDISELTLKAHKGALHNIRYFEDTVKQFEKFIDTCLENSKTLAKSLSKFSEDTEFYKLLVKNSKAWREYAEEASQEVVDVLKGVADGAKATWQWCHQYTKEVNEYRIVIAWIDEI